MMGSFQDCNLFQGVWVPEGENVKIPVAIKVLHDRTGADTKKDLLEETLIMATVEHPNLLKLLAVCDITNDACHTADASRLLA
jgi:L1 cell adhesion molecule